MNTPTRLTRRRLNTSRPLPQRTPGQKLAPRAPYDHGGHNQRSARRARAALMAEVLAECDGWEDDDCTARPLPRRIEKKAMRKHEQGQPLAGRRERRIVRALLGLLADANANA